MHCLPRPALCLGGWLRAGHRAGVPGVCARSGRCGWVGVCVRGAALLAGGPDGRHEVPEEPLPLRVPARLPRPAAQAPHPTSHSRRTSQNQPRLVPPRPAPPAALRRHSTGNQDSSQYSSTKCYKPPPAGPSPGRPAGRTPTLDLQTAARPGPGGSGRPDSQAGGPGADGRLACSSLPNGPRRPAPNIRAQNDRAPAVRAGPLLMCRAGSG